MRFSFALSIPFVIGEIVAGTAIADHCIELDATVVTVGNIASHIPAFEELPAELRFGLAPDPGLRRVISAGELNRFFAALTKAVSSVRRFPVESSLCFVRSSRTVSEAEMELALHGVFRNRTIQIEIVEISKRAVASRGMLRFSIHELPLGKDPSMAVTWNGWFVEADGRKRQVWARVRLREKVAYAVAQQDIAAGEMLSAENIRIEQRDSFPSLDGNADWNTDLFRKAARVPILAGELILPGRLTAIPTIRRGDIVTLEAISSQTRVAVQGKAESTAHRGQKVAIRTTLSKKVIFAIAQEKGRATVDPGPGTQERVTIP